MAVAGTAGGPGGAVQGLAVRVDTTRGPVYRVLRALVHVVNATFFRTSVSGPPVPEEGPVIVAPVHRSFIDFFVVSEVTGRKLHYMAKDSLWRRPRFGRFLESVGAFPVHRESADREALRRAQAVLDAGEVLILFPEGERRTGLDVGELHEGAAFLAARTGAVVVPVGIGGTATVMPKGKKVPRPRKVAVIAGEALAAPERGPGGRVARSRVHVLTEELRRRIQELYDRAVAAAGRA